MKRIILALNEKQTNDLLSILQHEINYTKFLTKNPQNEEDNLTSNEMQERLKKAESFKELILSNAQLNSMVTKYQHEYKSKNFG